MASKKMKTKIWETEGVPEKALDIKIKAPERVTYQHARKEFDRLCEKYKVTQVGREQFFKEFIEFRKYIIKEK